MKESIRIWVISLFPEYFEPLATGGVISQVLAGKRGPKVEILPRQLRDYSPKDFKGIDDAPYGGGHGMVMRADILKNALEGIFAEGNYEGEITNSLHIIYTTPRGKKWSASNAREFAQTHWSQERKKDVVFICGRYEGIDERFLNKYVDEEISIGDFVLTGGEIPVMLILDSAMRFIPGVLGNKCSSDQDSFEGEGLLECPFYTRPATFEGETVPNVLLSGDHKKIEQYRYSESLRVTKERRPDIYDSFKRGKSE